MATTISALPALTTPAAADVIPLDDASDSNNTKKITWANLFQSPALIAPALGTPTSGTLTNTTGFPVGNLAGAGTGVLTFLATPSSANLAAAVTGETGSGALVFGTSPTLTTPVLGAATATTINGLTITSGSTNTLTVASGASLITSGAFGLTLTATGTTNVTFPTTGTLATLAGSETLSNKTLTAPVIGAATGTSLSVTAAVTGYSGTAIPAGGTTGSGLKLSSTANFGVFFGSGAPTLSAAQGSIYLRSDGTPYYNTNGTTGWSAVGGGGSGDVTAASNFGTNESLIVADGTSKGVKSVPAVTVNSSGDLTTSGTLSTGAATVTSLLPATNDGAALGTGSLSFSDLFLASGGLINFANGNWTATHSSGILTVGTSMDIRMTTAGTNSASVVTVGGNQTLTSKTLTSPTLTTPVLGTPSSGNLSNCTALPASSLTAGTLAANVTLGESAGQIVLDQTLSADGTWSGIMQAGTAGATLAFGDLVYFSVTDSRWELVDADAEATAGNVLSGMCVLAAAADGDPTNILLYGKIRADANFPTLTVGAPVYFSTTPGDIQVAQPNGSGDIIRVAGYALTADAILFNPSSIYLTVA